MVLSLGIEPRFATSQAAVLSIERQELKLRDGLAMRIIMPYYAE